MRQSPLSKHSYVVNPTLAIIWIVWLLPTSNSIPNLFVFSGFYPKWLIGGVIFSSRLRDGAHWSSRRAPQRKCVLVIWVWARPQNSVVLMGVFGVRVCSVSLCLFEFVKARAGCCAPVWLIQTGPDLSLWISLLFPWWTKGAWRWWMTESSFTCFQMDTYTVASWDRMQWNKLWMCTLTSGRVALEYNMTSTILISFLYYVVILKSTTTSAARSH